jgi:enamine deaminase RidA (YjgF/YER057c/UK114 family)
VGCSLTCQEVLGPKAGVGARWAIGQGSLPRNISVEIEAIFEVTDGAPSLSSRL